MRSCAVLVGALAGLAAGALMDNPPPSRFIRRSYAAAVVMGDYVYIDGGEMSQKLNQGDDDDDFVHTMMNSTLSFNVSTSWPTGKVNIYSADKPAPKLIRQALWPGPKNDMFYIWGGRTVNGLNRNKISKDLMWRFATDGKGRGQWSSEIPSGSDDFDEMGLPQRGAFTTVGNTGFWFGGTILKDSYPDVDVEMRPVQGMMTFDMGSKTFTNESTPDVSPQGTILGGTAEYIPDFGPNGLVMILGGYGYTLDTNLRSPEHTRRFDNLTFFDPESREWYWQMATGEIPAPRLDHCSVGVKSSSDTYEIFVFGGYDPTNSRTYGDVHVLSLPGFVWRRIDATSGGLRSGQACVVAGNRQMLTIGGVDPQAEKTWGSKDPFPQGLGIFDMTELKWKEDFDHKAAAYDSPEPIQKWYSGGGLDSVDWSSTRTEALFTSVSPDVPEDDSSSSSTKTGAIAGGVVGGVAGVALIGGLAWWLLRRRRRAAAGADPEYSSVGRTEMDDVPRASEMPSEGPTPKPGELSPDATPAPVVGELPAEAASPAPVELDGSSPVVHRG